VRYVESVQDGRSHSIIIVDLSLGRSEKHGEGKWRQRGTGNRFREGGLIKDEEREGNTHKKQVLLTSSSSLVHLVSM